MSRISTHHVSSVCLIGIGVLVWAYAGRPLVADKDLKVPLNPMGINGSPYGEVLAMAMQGPISTYSDVGMHGQPHQHGKGADHSDHSNCGNTCKDAHAKKPDSLRERFEDFITELSETPAIRTNPYAAGDALRFYLRRQAEDKLRFAYQLDPSHYGNYAILHFFLTQPSVGTRPHLTPLAEKLAQDTIQYCLKQEDDPRPALTAAAAATHLIHLMFADLHTGEKPKFTTSQMRQYLDVLKLSIARYDQLAKEWDETKNWELLSPMRIEECEDRIKFVKKISRDAEQTILRLEGKPQNQVSN